MTMEEKRAWVVGGAAVVSLVGYAIWISLLLTDPITDTPFVVPMLVLVGLPGLVVAVAVIWLRAITPDDENEVEGPRRRIVTTGDQIAQWILLVGALTALLLALAEADRFWIAHALYAAFVLSALIGAGDRLIAHRRSAQPA